MAAIEVLEAHDWGTQYSETTSTVEQICSISGASFTSGDTYLVIYRLGVWGNNANNNNCVGRVREPDSSAWQYFGLNWEPSSTTRYITHGYARVITADGTNDAALGISGSGATTYGADGSIVAINLDDIGTSGTDYWDEWTDTSEANTTSWANKETITMTPTAGDDLLIIGSAQIEFNNANLQGELELAKDGTRLTGSMWHSIEGEDTDAESQFLMFGVDENVDATSRTYQLRARDDGNGTQNNTAYRQLIVIPLSNFESYSVNLGSDVTTPTTAAWTTAASVTHTPDTTGTQVILGGASLEYPYVKARLQVDSVSDPGDPYTDIYVYDTDDRLTWPMATAATIDTAGDSVTFQYYAGNSNCKIYSPLVVAFSAELAAGGSDATATPTAAAFTTTAPAVSISAAAAPSPSTAALTTAAPAATVVTTTDADVDVTAAAFTLTAPSVTVDTTTDATAVPAAAEFLLSSPAVAVSAGAGQSPVAAPLGLTAPPVTVATDATATPTAAAFTLTAPAVTVSAGTTTEPAAAAVSVTAPTVTLSAGATVEPAAAAAALTAPTVTVSTAGDATATPTTAAFTASSDTPAVSAGATITPTAAAAAVTAPAVTVSTTGDATATPSTAALPVTAPATAVSTSATVSATAAAFTLTAPAATVATGADTTTTPSTAVFGLFSDNPLVAAASTVTPDAAELTVLVPTATSSAASTVLITTAAFSLYAPLVNVRVAAVTRVEAATTVTTTESAMSASSQEHKLTLSGLGEGTMDP